MYIYADIFLDFLNLLGFIIVTIVGAEYFDCKKLFIWYENHIV